MKVQIDPYTMTSGDVARVLDVTDETVRRYDDVLRPKRRTSGQRRYRPQDVSRSPSSAPLSGGRSRKQRSIHCARRCSDGDRLLLQHEHRANVVASRRRDDGALFGDRDRRVALHCRAGCFLPRVASSAGVLRGQDAQRYVFERQPKYGKHELHSRNWIIDQVHRVCDLARVARVTAHAMRGLLATITAERGLAGHLIAATFGHENASTTMTAHAKPGSAAAGARRRDGDVLEGGANGTAK